MNKETKTISNDLNQLVEDAQALMTATADVAGDKVKEARKRLAGALEHAKEMGDSLREQAAAATKVVDDTIRKNPYPAIAVGVGIGALIGILVSRR